MRTQEDITLLKDIKLNYEEVAVFDNLTIDVLRDHITCIIGPSGCGKTSILNLLAGLIKDYEGQVLTANERIGYVFQEDRLLPWETVYDNIRLVRDEEDQEAIEQLLKALALYDFRDKKPSQLSGGMKQRTSLARGFYYQASLLLMDEPFKSLDYDLRLNLVRYLGNLWEKTSNTIVFVTHDIDEALLLGHRIVVLSKRPTKIIECFEPSLPIGERKISDLEHQSLRSSIIEHMSYSNMD